MPPSLSSPGPRRFERTAAPSDAGLRLDRFWARELAAEGVSREKVKDWIKAGLALVDGAVARKPNLELAGTESLALAGDMPAPGLTPVDRDLAVLHQDAHVAVIAKPPGLTVHPAPSVEEPTLAHVLVSHFPQIADQDPDRPGIVHRLDKDTSGLLAVALTEAARLALSRDFAERRTVKAYLALVSGKPPTAGSIDAPMGRDPRAKTRMAVRTRDGREARSDYRTLWTAPGGRASLVLVRIHTGRTHQIRVHLSHLGHPLLGDPTYGFRPERLPGVDVPRVMLHSFFLGLAHPATGAPPALALPPPPDFLDTLAALSRQPLRLGLTGSAGSGKSALLAEFKALGLPCFSADEAVARLYARGGDAFHLITARFGQELAAPDGSGLDRGRLLALMRDKEAVRREVMDLVHPMVAHAMEMFFAQHAEAPAPIPGQTPILAAEIPLLLESDPSFRRGVDLIAGVFCPDRTRHSRILSRGGPPDLPALLDSWQWPQADKMRACHLVVDNTGPRETLPAKAAALVAAVRGVAAHREAKFRAWLDGLWPELVRGFEAELDKLVSGNSE